MSGWGDSAAACGGQWYLALVSRRTDCVHPKCVFISKVSLGTSIYMCVCEALITALSKGDSWAPRGPQGISCNRGDWMRTAHIHERTHTRTLSRTFSDMTSFSREAG